MCWVINFARKRMKKTSHHRLWSVERGGKKFWSLEIWRFSGRGCKQKSLPKKKKKQLAPVKKRMQTLFEGRNPSSNCVVFFGWQVVILREFQSGKKTAIEVLTCPCRNECDWDVAVCTIASFPCKQPRSNLDKAKSWGKRSKTITASQRINRLRNLTFVGCTTEEFTAGQFVRVVPWRQNWMCSVTLHDFVIFGMSYGCVPLRCHASLQECGFDSSIWFHPKYQNHPREKFVKTDAKENVFDFSTLFFLSFRWVSRPKVSSTANLAYSWNGTRCCGNFGIYGVVFVLIFTSICCWSEIHFDSNLRIWKIYITMNIL